MALQGGRSSDDKIRDKKCVPYRLGWPVLLSCSGGGGVAYRFEIGAHGVYLRVFPFLACLFGLLHNGRNYPPPPRCTGSIAAQYACIFIFCLWLWAPNVLDRPLPVKSKPLHFSSFFSTRRQYHFSRDWSPPPPLTSHSIDVNRRDCDINNLEIGNYPQVLGSIQSTVYGCLQK
jgi:hypothetical protein